MGKSTFEIQAVLEAYATGHFPMADGANAPMEWFRATHPAILPIDHHFHISRSLARHMRRTPYTFAWDLDFTAILQGCATRPAVWISAEVQEFYQVLRNAGIAHGFGAYRDGILAGGVLGIALGSAFIGESMFTAREDGGKAALVLLVEELRRRGYTHFDCQILNAHTERFGAYEVDGPTHRSLLAEAVGRAPRDPIAQQTKSPGATPCSHPD